jgi:hypothetical protein
LLPGPASSDRGEVPAAVRAQDRTRRPDRRPQRTTSGATDHAISTVRGPGRRTTVRSCAQRLHRDGRQRSTGRDGHRRHGGRRRRSAPTPGADPVPRPPCPGGRPSGPPAPATAIVTPPQPRNAGSWFAARVTVPGGGPLPVADSIHPRRATPRSIRAGMLATACVQVPLGGGPMIWALLAAFLRNRPPWLQAVMFGTCTGLVVAARAFSPLPASAQPRSWCWWSPWCRCGSARGFLHDGWPGAPGRSPAP